MVSSGMLRHVTLVRTDVSEELSASFIRVTKIGELGTTLAVTSILNSEFHSSFLSHLVFLRSVCRLLVTASVVPSSPIFGFWHLRFEYHSGNFHLQLLQTYAVHNLCRNLMLLNCICKCMIICK
jgi:hypothetical protein